MPYSRIEDYAIIGDGLTVALVSREGSIDWACFPRFDAPSVFGRLLDDQKGGFFEVRPEGAFTASRRYLPDTNVLQTTFRTAEGEAEVIDMMPGGSLRRPDVNRIHRRIRGVSGTVRFIVTLEPRFDYARRDTTWSTQPGAGVRAIAGGEGVTLYGDIDCAVSGARATARLDVSAGDTRWLTLEYRERPTLWRPPSAVELDETLDDTIAYWRRWICRCVVTGYRDEVTRSALALKLLDYEPTGAVVAAPTTSLPERIGGVRNWDYRYAWVRDTAFSVYAFSLLGRFDEGERFFEWLLGVVPHPRALQVMYGIDGETDLTEHTLAHLSGYENSSPVRIGNAAYSQTQLDIYGDLLDAAYILHRAGRPITRDLWPFLSATADHVVDIWRRPDQGIWEIRGEPQHFVASKAHCWMALRRAGKIAKDRGYDGHTSVWAGAAETIMREIMTKGIDPATGSFRQAYGSDQVDAALLQLQLRKVVRPGDPRMVATIERIERELDASRAESDLAPGLIRRYRTTKLDDGLPPGEGVFLMCSFWLVDCYAEMGQIDKARALFERLLGYANDVGLYAEEFDPHEKRHLGNFPQAFTHVALINAAAALENAPRE